MQEIISSGAYASLMSSPAAREEASPLQGCNYLLVDFGEISLASDIRFPACPVIGLGVSATDTPNIDLVAENLADAERLITAIQAHPIAASTLVQLTRHNEKSDIDQGLFAESLAYSTLQQSAEFKRWLNKAERPTVGEQCEPPVIVERDAEILTVTLNQPLRHNAYNAQTRDLLCEALALTCEDDTISQLIIRGAGNSFCAGGDLSEFGEATDAAVAHHIRTSRSAASLLSHLPCLSKSHVQGACIGAGIELPAFTTEICALHDAFFQLPEVAMGLVPGAGGTVSILARIGRHRLNYLAISNKRINAETALQWGLIDSIT